MINIVSSICSSRLMVYRIFIPFCACIHIVGDLHGDLDQTRCALEMAGVLSSDGEDLWTGGETVNSEPLIWFFYVIKPPSFGEHEDKFVSLAT